LVHPAVMKQGGPHSYNPGTRTGKNAKKQQKSINQVSSIS